MHPNEHWVVQLRKYIDLNRGAFHVQFVFEVSFLDALERIELTFVRAGQFPDQMNLTKSTFTEHFNELKIFSQLILIVYIGFGRYIFRLM